MRIENYFFTDIDSKPVDLASHEGEYFINGYVYGRPGFIDGSSVRTSSIEKLSDSSATTYSGSVYELGEVNKDYAEMLEAKKNGVTILTNWFIDKEHFLKDDHKNYSDVCKKFRDGLGIRGTNPLDGEMISGEIIDQNGNYLTIRNGNEDVKCFIVWRDYEFTMEMMIGLGILKSNTGLDYADFDYAFNMKCRPKIA